MILEVRSDELKDDANEEEDEVEDDDDNDATPCRSAARIGTTDSGGVGDRSECREFQRPAFVCQAHASTGARPP